MMELEAALREFGLSEKEARIYINTLRLGTSTANRIAEEAGIPRTTAYDLLKSLLDKGLASHVMKGGIKYFEATDPREILARFEGRAEKLKELMPDLLKIKKSIIEKPKLELYEGKEGLNAILNDILRNAKGGVLVYASATNQLGVLKYGFPKYVQKRIAAKIRTRVIVEKTKFTLEQFKNRKKELREMKFVPAGFEFPTAVYIYANKVAILSLERDITGVVVQNEEFARTQRMVFELMWKSL